MKPEKVGRVASWVNVLIEDSQMSQRRVEGVCITLANNKPQSVIVTSSDGIRHQGTTVDGGGPVIFIESKEMASVGTDVTIEGLAREDSTRQSLDGTVVWQCDSGDEFGNPAGFAVRLKANGTRTPNRSGQTEKEGT